MISTGLFYQTHIRSASGGNSVSEVGVGGRGGVKLHEFPTTLHRFAIGLRSLHIALRKPLQANIEDAIRHATR